MAWASFARLLRPGTSSVWCGALPCALGFGLVLALATVSAAADRTGVQRETEETRDVAAEVSKAVRRVQAENLTLQRTLPIEVRNLTVEDVTAAVLRLGRLDADTARLHFTTLDNRIAQRQATLRLLDEDIKRREDLQGGPATLETLGAEAELQQLRELRAVTADLVDGLRVLQNAESEHLALAEERLALLRSRAELQTIRGNDGLDQDPRALAIKAVITRLGREAIQLYNEVATTRPKEKPDPARKAFPQLEAGDAIIRSSVRVGDLDLIRVGNQLDFFEELIKDDSLPIPILHEARSELGADHARLQSRLATVRGDRLTLDGQRELVGAQATESKSAAVSPLGTVQDLAQLLDFQQADIMRLQQRLDEMAARLDSVIVQREFSALHERRSLPSNLGHWQLVKGELIRLPQMTVDYWQGMFSALFARLVALPARALAGLGAAILVLCGVLWALDRIVLARIAMLNPAGQSSVPLEALRRSLPLFVPMAGWIVIARTLGVAEHPSWLLAGALALLPLAGFLLDLSALLFAGARWRSPVPPL